jgi:hypothetical protein
MVVSCDPSLENINICILYKRGNGKNYSYLYHLSTCLYLSRLYFQIKGLSFAWALCLYEMFDEIF